ncbi:MAG: nuclear transport factor 2 family protein [Gemmatimonadetes bacterium]|jgi:ketosteroid isomerase-like protein|nr:nuclear transport factor 2 family protein [Gemmatimonadota bacterium]
MAPVGTSRDSKRPPRAARTRCRLIRFELLNLVADDNTVVVEVEWSGTLGVSVGDLGSGTVMRARFAQFFEFQDGRIVAQRNYDCFYPW